MSTTAVEKPAPETRSSDAPRWSRGRVGRRATSLAAQGEPWMWLAGGALATAVAMIAGLLALIVVRGGATFWPRALVQVERAGATPVLGEVYTTEPARDGAEARRMLRTENFDLTGEHFVWVPDSAVVRETSPEWALVIDRLSWGRLHGEPVALLVDGKTTETEPAAVVAAFEREHDRVRERLDAKERIERDEIGAVNRALEDERLALRRLDEHTRDNPAMLRAAEEASKDREDALQRRHEEIALRIAALDAENDRYALRVRVPGGALVDVALSDVVRAYAANRLAWTGKLSVYFARWWEYVSEYPRGSDGEGGVYPAIFGTIVMTLLMSIAVVPFGVLAALYLREYARQGFLLGLVRIAVNNLAGVPSIVFGVFGLGFFCVMVGSSIDELFFSDRLPNPTYGKGGLLWASLTLALLTLPVVIVATEEAIAAVPNSMREGSYACGATKWQTIRRIVLPRALPGIMTGMILAIARGAGEVAPLMLVGAVKMAPQLAVDGTAPYVHPERSFLHLGYQIFDLGFQTQNSEAAKPLVFTTTLILISIVVALNLAAISIRSRLRKKYVTNPF